MSANRGESPGVRQYRMQIQDWVLRPGAGPLEGTSPNSRVGALLPARGISIGPPSAEDRVEISPIACAVLQANEELAGNEMERVERLHLAYTRGRWTLDPARLAGSLLASLDKRNAPPVVSPEGKQKPSGGEGMRWRWETAAGDSPDAHLAALFPKGNIQERLIPSDEH